MNVAFPGYQQGQNWHTSMVTDTEYCAFNGSLVEEKRQCSRARARIHFTQCRQFAEDRMQRRIETRHCHFDFTVTRSIVIDDIFFVAKCSFSTPMSSVAEVGGVTICVDLFGRCRWNGGTKQGDPE